LNNVRFRSLAPIPTEPMFRFGTAFMITALAISQASATDFKTVAGSYRHPEASMASAIAVDASENIHMAISLLPNDQAGMEAYAKEVSNPSSIFYRQFLTPEEVGVRFGPSQTVIDETVSYLASKGIAVDHVAKNGLVIVADGKASQIEDAFKTSLGYVPRDDAPGTFRTNFSALSLPTNLAGKVLSIDGVDTSVRMKRAATTTTLTPVTYRAAFSAASLYSRYFGEGVNVAIANYDGFNLDNIPLWVSTYHMPSPTSGAGKNIFEREVGTGATYGSGADGYGAEGDLDLQAVLMSAPLANVYEYDDSVTDSAAPITTLEAISSDNIADVCTESYGWETSKASSRSTTYFGAEWTSAYNIHTSLSIQGIVYCAATGDSGTANFPATGTRYGYPDIDPNVLNVGGSVATVNTVTGALSSESSWGYIKAAGTPEAVGGTGGFDPYDTTAHGFAFNVAPSYETSTLGTKTTTYPYRLLPDVSSFAGGQNGLGEYTSPYADWAMVIYFHDGATYPLGTGTQIDGTSIASPATAGSLAAVLSELYLTTNPNPSRSNVRVGELQPLLYANGGSATVFHDITAGTSIGNLPGTSIAATPATGWDYATGWGSINFSGLYTLLSAHGF
jgi:kumamolisin